MSGPVLGNNDNASLQSIDVGTASTKNVLPDFSLFRITSSLPPRTRSEIPGWLATLDEMDSAPNTGEIFVAAVNLRNNTENSQWFINPYGPAVESIAIHFYLNDKQVLTRTGLYHNDTVLLQQGAFIELPKGESGTLLLVYNSDFYFSKLKVRILDASQIDETLNSNTILTLFALGILLASGVYNLFFYYASRDSVYLYLTLCIVLLATGWCNLLGILQFPSPDIIRFTLIPPFLLSIACAIQFTRKFLDLNNISTKLDNGLSLLFWLCVLTTPITALTPAHGIYMTYTGSILMVMLSLTAATVALKRHYKPARFFIIAYSAFGLQAVIWFLLSLIPELQLNINLSLVGLVSTTLGVILLSLTLLAKVSHITQENNRLANNLELKVYERTEALAEANVALEHLICELQEASSAKSSFLANMSHEIRTPLTSIIGYADGILMGDISRDEQERVIRVISENGNHLLHIISDILDISKIEADKLEYEMLPTRITDIITQVESVIAKRAQDKELEFKLNYHFPIPSEVETDPYRFKQILLNLTNNAVKFTDCGEISIDVRYQNEQLFVRVKDSGIGMPAEKIAAIFEPFEQGDTSVARQFGGTGLGLSISKRLALDLGGDIHATSEVNKGSSFEVVIRAVPTENNEMLGASKDMWKMQEIKEENHIIPDFSGSKVLLVDDHPNNRDLIRIILDRMHVTVTEAEDGDIALQRMFEAEYDLILMDIQMPRMKGDEATEKLRQQGFDLPIIALTANNEIRGMTRDIKFNKFKKFAEPVQNDLGITSNRFKDVHFAHFLDIFKISVSDAIHIIQ